MIITPDQLEQQHHCENLVHPVKCNAKKGLYYGAWYVGITDRGSDLPSDLPGRFADYEPNHLGKRLCHHICQHTPNSPTARFFDLEPTWLFLQSLN